MTFFKRGEELNRLSNMEEGEQKQNKNQEEEIIWWVGGERLKNHTQKKYMPLINL